MLKERLAELLSRKISGEATSTELQELEGWLQLNPGDQYFSDILLTYWNTHNDNSSADTTSDQHFAHILEMAGENSENMVPAEVAAGQKKAIFVRRFRKMAMAASFAGIITLFAWMSIKNKAIPKGSDTINDQQKTEVVANKGARPCMVLPDGTQVCLNSDSKLQYEESFNDTIREVTLEGEAYFDVVRDVSRPFIVHTSAIDIRVLGTSFNVKSYPGEKTIETTLIHGSVVVTDKNKPQSPKFILRPKQKLLFDKLGTGFTEVNNTNSPSNRLSEKNGSGTIIPLPKNIADTLLIETSWVYDKLLFDGDTFRELAIKMERWFNVKISFKNEKVAGTPLSGSFKDEDIVQALQALKIIVPFNYRIINNNEVVIN